MRRSLAPLTALALVTASCGRAPEVTPEMEQAAAAKAADAANRLVERLLEELTSALGSGPPENAVDLCHDVAQQMTREVAEEQGFAIGRTALRVRNPDNAPDTWERSVLAEWADTTGDLKPRTKVVETEDGPALRWMSPIRLVGMCTQCHGDDTQITTATRAAIQDRYPDDQATDFAVGDLRGAFTATVPLE